MHAKLTTELLNMAGAEYEVFYSSQQKRKKWQHNESSRKEYDYSTVGPIGFIICHTQHPSSVGF